MTEIAFIGLGVMGNPMARHLAQAGHDLTVFNRTTKTADDWVQKNGGKTASTPADAAKNADIVISCVGNDADLRMVTLGKGGAFGTMAPGTVYIDCTTTSASLARELSETGSQRGIRFLDAPISGGQAGAEGGLLTVMVGGSKEDFDHVQPMLEIFARKVTRIGDVGAGQTAKMVNQICIAGTIQGLAEGMAFAKQAGLDITRVMESISEGAAGSWQMSNRWETMEKGEFDHGFAVDWMRKDLGIALDEVKRIGATAPLTALVDQFYADVQNSGGGRLDTSALLTRFLDKTDFE